MTFILLRICEVALVSKGSKLLHTRHNVHVKDQFDSTRMNRSTAMKGTVTKCKR